MRLVPIQPIENSSAGAQSLPDSEESQLAWFVVAHVCYNGGKVSTFCAVEMHQKWPRGKIGRRAEQSETRMFPFSRNDQQPAL